MDCCLMIVEKMKMDELLEEEWEMVVGGLELGLYHIVV
jgi:hypothetical protein